MRASGDLGEGIIGPNRFLHGNSSLTDPCDIPERPIKGYVTQKWRRRRSLTLTQRGRRNIDQVTRGRNIVIPTNIGSGLNLLRFGRRVGGGKPIPIPT